MAVIGNAPFQGLVSGGEILDASIEGVDLSTSAIAARLGYTPVNPAAAAITGGTITGLSSPLPVASGGTGVATSTGSGSMVLSTSPTLVTPALGTPSALVGTNITGTATAFTASNVTTNANLTGVVTSVGNATSLGSFTSAQLATALTDETGSGANVFATSPTLVTPNLGVATATSLQGIIGNVTPAAGTFTTVTASSNISADNAFLGGNLTLPLTGKLNFNGSTATDYMVGPSSGTIDSYIASTLKTRLTSTGLQITGTLSATGNLTSLTAQFGTNPAGVSIGVIGIPNQKRIYGRNTANTADINILYVSGNDTVVFGPSDVATFSTAGLAVDGTLSVGPGSGAGGIAVGSAAGRAQYQYVNFGGAVGGTDYAWQIGRSPSGGVGPADGFYIYDLKASATRLSINGSGNVGVGTADPQNRLHVGGTDTVVRLSDTNGGVCFWGSDSVGTFWRSFTYDTFRWLRASGTESMRLNSSGDLLVGVTTNHTGAKLYVENAINVNYSGEIAMRYNVSGQSTSYWKGMTGTMPGAGGSARGLHFFNYDADSDEGINFWTGRPGSATQLMKLTAAGNLAMGTTNPAGLLDIGANTLSTNIYFRNNSTYSAGSGGGTTVNVVFGGVNIARIANTGTGQRDGHFTLLDENVVKVSIAANSARGGDTYFNTGGNFGIGTTNPIAKLHIEGNSLTLNTENSAQAKTLYFRYSNGATVQSDSYLTFNTGGSPQERVRITSTGNMGIGTTNPLTKLSINSPAHDTPTQPGSGRILNWYSGVELWNNEHSITVGNNNSSTIQPMHVGLSLFNNSTADYTWSPAITFNALSINGGYMNSGAAIAAQLIDNANDHNFRGGNLHFYTSPLTATNKGLASRMIIDYEGKVGINNSNPLAKLHISTSSSTAFSAADNSWHSIIVNNQASANTHASGICFEVANVPYHSNAGTGIAAVKNGNSADYGADLVFITRGQSAPASEKMRILGNGKINTAGVSVFYTSGYSDISTTFYIDVPVENDNGGLANTYHIEASISHANWSGYGALLDTWYNARGAVPSQFNEQYDTRVVNSSNGGSWTISKPAANSLRITHNAGTYSGGAYYWIRVTMNA